MTTDEDVRDLLRERAASITPAADGLERIEARLAGETPVVTTARRRPPMPMLAAAAVLVVVALVGVVLATRGDDEQPIVTTPGPDSAKELGAVWPSNDPSVLRSISASWAMDESPLPGARMYLEERIGTVPADDAFDVVRSDEVPEHATVSVTDDGVDTILSMRRLDGDGPWYVEFAESGFIGAGSFAYDGTTARAPVTPIFDGELTGHYSRADGSGPVADTSAAASAGVEVDMGAGWPESSEHAGRSVVATIVLQTTDGVVALTDRMLPAPATPAPTTREVPLGVWPWPDDSVDEAVFGDAGNTARAYVASRVTEVGATTETGRTESDGTVAITFGGDVSTTVYVRQSEGRWYVESSASDLVTLHDAGDGTVTARVETGGELVRMTSFSGSESSSESSSVQGGEEYPGLGYTLGRDDVAIRELFVLDTVDGTIGVTETSFRAGEAPSTPNTPTSPSSEEQLGVWPTLGDDVDESALTDPVTTAQQYVLDTVGLTEETTFSDFREQDSTSGEVEVGGDVTATIVLRRVDGRWHVETVWSPMVESSELRPGEVLLKALVDGVLQVTVLDSQGIVVQSMPESGVVAGQERLVVPDAPDGTPLTVRWALHTPMDATPGRYANVALGDVRLYGGACCSSEPAVGTQVPDDAIWDVAALDARELASQYLGDRLGGRTVTVSDTASIDGDRAEVTWEAGVVLLRKVDDHWFVTESIGDSIQIESQTTLRLAQAGTVHLTRGTQTMDVRNDVDREGTIVEFDLPGESDVLRAVFETDTGFVSLAEKKL